LSGHPHFQRGAPTRFARLELLCLKKLSTGWVLALTAAAQFVLQLDFAIVNVALPTVQHELGFTSAGLQWVVPGYALTFGALLLVGGRFGEVVSNGRRNTHGYLSSIRSLANRLAGYPSPEFGVVGR
jgi:MFS family permease